MEERQQATQPVMGDFDAVYVKNLKLRSHLMMILVHYIEEKGFTQKDAARVLHVSQPRISNLLGGKIHLFSVGMLLNMVERAGFQIYSKLHANTLAQLMTCRSTFIPFNRATVAVID